MGWAVFVRVIERVVGLAQGIQMRRTGEGPFKFWEWSVWSRGWGFWVLDGFWFAWWFWWIRFSGDGSG